MKKFISVLLAMVLLLGTCAFAEESCFPQTQYLMNALDAQELTYSNEGKTEEGKDHIRTAWADADFDPVIVHIYLEEAGTVSYRIWNLLTINCGENYAYHICNTLNSQYKYAKFYLDTSDNTISVEADMEINTGADNGDACVEMMRDLIKVIDDARETLLVMR